MPLAVPFVGAFAPRPTRRNPVSHEVEWMWSPRDVARMNAMEARLRRLEAAAERAYALGMQCEAEVIDAEATELAARLDDLIAALEEEGEEEKEAQFSVDEAFAQVYADWLEFQAGGARRIFEPANLEGLASVLRDAAIEGHAWPGRKTEVVASDEQLVAAAREAYEQRRRRHRRPSVASAG